jgi:hypothetical protein
MVKDGETLEQIAQDQLHDKNLSSEIKFKWDFVQNKQVEINGTAHKGDTLLLPPLSPDFLSKHQAANTVLAELKTKADKETITADEYYAQRKLILSVL